MLEFLELLVPKVHWGLKKMWKKFWEFAKKIADLRRNFVRPTLSNLLPPARLFSNLATRWQPSTTDSRNTLLILSLTKVLKVCEYKCYFSYPS